MIFSAKMEIVPHRNVVTASIKTIDILKGSRHFSYKIKFRMLQCEKEIHLVVTF